MNDNLKKLEELTARLPNLVDAFGSGSIVVYKAEEGAQAIGISLWKEKAVAAQRCFMAAGSKLAIHCHDEETEFLIVYRGHLMVTMDGKDIHLKPTDVLRIAPPDPHSATAMEDTWVLAVTVPAAEGYP